MKTTFEKIIDSDVNTLVDTFNEAIELIKETVLSNRWRITNSAPKIESFSSKSSRKSFRDKLNKVLYKPTIKNINCLHSDFQVKVSEKEELIQLKRKAWKIAQANAEKLLAEYKEEKGNFYK